MHILPKGFIRTRFYGGYSYTKRKAYLEYLLNASIPGPLDVRMIRG